jgi:hypothetical protein
MGCPGTGRPGAGRLAPPIGTPGCTGGVGRSGALYTGRGPVCGTIIRGTGGGGAAGRGAIVAAGVALAEGASGTAGGACIAGGGGAAGRMGAVGTNAGATGGAATGRTGATGDKGDAGTVVAGAGTGAGFTRGGATVVGWLTAAGGATAGFSTGAGVGAGCVGRGGIGAGAAASLRCVIAFSTSPGREMLDKSILVLISSSPRDARELDLAAEEEPSPERMYARTFSASCSSRELECVFFSVTPTSGRVSRMALLLTSSSLARSLIRTLLIRPFVSPRC